MTNGNVHVTEWAVCLELKNVDVSFNKNVFK